jgi:hypothetical protein
MTNFSPDLPTLHAHTHRPKALGGTDPIEIAAGQIPFALASGGVTDNGSPFAVDEVTELSGGDFETNDAAVFDFDATDEAILILQAGVYDIVTVTEVIAGDVPDYPDSILVVATEGATIGGLSPGQIYVVGHPIGAADYQPPMSKVLIDTVLLGSPPFSVRPYTVTSDGSGEWSINNGLFIYRIGDSAGALLP